MSSIFAYYYLQPMPTVGFLPMRHSTYGLLLLQMAVSQVVREYFPSPRAGHIGCITQKCAHDATVQSRDSQAQTQQDLHAQDAPVFAEWRTTRVLLSE